MNDFKDKVVLITGGSGGIGSTAGKMFAARGAKVMLVDIDKEALKQVVKKIGKDQAAYVAADVSDEKQVKNYVDKTMEIFGRVDVFFNNAGIEGKVKPLDEYPLEEFENAKSSFEQAIPLGRYATNEEVVKMVLFLAGEDSEFITGTINPVDGGMTA